MKRIFLSILVLVVINFSVTAQDTTRATKQNTGAAHKGKKQNHEDIINGLNLTQTQKKELMANRMEGRTKTAAIKNDKSLTEAQKREQLATLQKTQKEKKELLLNPEQKDKLQLAKTKNMQEEKEAAEKRRADMKEKLSLTDGQDIKLNELAKTNQAKIKAIRENSSLDAEAKKKQMDELRQHAAEQRKEILSPEQLKKMEELKSERKEHQTRKVL